ncbi:hypothetical protein AC1031_009787 [Aphanomyces cochlioides]|nr:hypothetical protein AC1031_009787 [Aphanomyces cochlioides]
MPRASKIADDVVQAFQEARFANVLVYHGGTAEGLANANRVIKSQPDCIRSKEVRTALCDHATKCQACVSQVLSRYKVEKAKSFWIANVVHVANATWAVVAAIAQCKLVSSISLEPVIQLNGAKAMRELSSTAASATAKVTWGVQQIGAPNVWAKGYSGQKVVVGSIDTGVLYTHEALKGKWRQDHGWYDPKNFSRLPYDKKGHGTHTMGTILGSNGIGVAPNASYIACLGCRDDVCLADDLLACAQFMLCPTNATGGDVNCTLHPHVINNSWGGRGDYSWFDASLAAWRAAGIVPVFPIGNDGPSCGSAANPGNSPQVIGVGATGNANILTVSDVLASFSSRGGFNGRIKPDITAPGYYVWSSVISSNSSYEFWAGTSLAAPHVTGSIALLLSMNLSSTYNDVYNRLMSTADTATLTPSRQNCDWVLDTQYPNNNYGYGRVNVSRAISANTNSVVRVAVSALPDF